MNNCGISRWDDPNEINARLKALTSQPIWEVTDEYYNNVILNYFDEKCKASKAVYEESKEYIPGGVQHNLAFNKPFPMCMARADGAYLYDKDGNQYIDFLQAGGPTILGSNYPVIREKVIELLNECGPVTGLLHESELMIAKEINRHMPNVEMFRMLGSGTESVMAALRIARIATGKKRIIKVGGAYHGWSDQMVYGLKIPGSRALLESHGIPGGCYEATDEVRPNDLTMLEDMLKRNVLLGGTAGIIVEPLGPESGTRPVAHDYNAGVRTLCDKYGALMIFDEVVTGFRVALSGAQGYFGVVPDLTVFGKIVAGGYPAARRNTRSSWRPVLPQASTGRMSAAHWRPILCPASPGTRPSVRLSARTPARSREKWATACVTASRGCLTGTACRLWPITRAPSCISSARAR